MKGINGFKPHEPGVWDTAGFNRWLAGTGAVGIATESVNGSLDFVQGLWNEDPNTFRRAGNSMGHIAMEASTIGLSLWFGLATHRRMSREGFSFFGKRFAAKDVYDGVWFNRKAGEAYKMAEGSTRANPILKALHNGGKGAELTGLEAKNFMKGAKKGLWRSQGRWWTARGASQFVGKGMTGALGFAAMIVAPMLIGAVATPMLGFAGSVFDEVSQEYHHAKRPYYDNRFFNTQRWEMNANQQLGAAMNQYENNNISLARIYHAR